MTGLYRTLSLLFLSLLTFGMVACSGGGAGAPGDPSNSGDPTLGRTISGKVTDLSGTAITGVTVRLSGTTTDSYVTGSDGTYSFVNLPIGTYSVSAEKDGLIFAPSSYDNISTATNFYTTNKDFLVNIVYASGVVTNVAVPDTTDTLWRVEGATVTAVPLDGGSTVVATTNSGGIYSIPLVNGKTYAITFTYSYNGAPYVLPVVYYYLAQPMNNSLDTVPLLADPEQTTGTGTATGTIVNAYDGNPAPGLTIDLRSGINPPKTNAIVKSTTTDADGLYTFADMAPGVYTATVTGQVKNANEFVPQPIASTDFTVIVVGGATYSSQDYGVTQVLPAGEYRIVLSWESAPRDLDSHLTGPAVPGDSSQTASRFHTWYSNKTYQYNGVTYAALDHDDTTSYGPETTTIYEQLSGVYQFSVHNFSAESALAGCGAKVKVYAGSSVVATFNVPTTGTGNVWRVFQLYGSTIVPINTLYTVSSPANIN